MDKSVKVLPGHYELELTLHPQRYEVRLAFVFENYQAAERAHDALKKALVEDRPFALKVALEK